MKGTIEAICVSRRKGRQKRPVQEIRLVRGHGLDGDAHAGPWHRQVSLLAGEQIDPLRSEKLKLPPGAFGENLVTRGIDLAALRVGQRLRLGESAVVQITQRGKECHKPCVIRQAVGDCIMPRQGLFGRVRRGGELCAGDAVATDAELDRLRYAVVTLSDRGAAGERPDDPAGDAVQRMVEQELGGLLVSRTQLPDEVPAIERELCRLCDEEICDLVLTTGGTGLSPRDVTPEATRAVIEREVPGMAEAMRAAGLAHTPRAMLSRAVVGLRGETLIVNLSGSPKAVKEQLDVVLPVLGHAVETASGVPLDCGAPR